jgi:hypothetical protein
MINRHLKVILITGLALILFLTSCSNATDQSITATITPLPIITAQPKILATPYAQQPAAGICASADAAVVTITLYTDIPDPRCSKARADQTLQVINQTQGTLQISIGDFNFPLEAGASASIDTPFGAYLEPGVHQLQVIPCCGAELWLEE